MKLRESFLKVAVFQKWLTGGAAIGLLLLVLDKAWDQKISREQAALQMKQMSERQKIEEERELRRNELEKRLHEERLQVLRRQEQIVARLLPESNPVKQQDSFSAPEEAPNDIDVSVPQPNVDRQPLSETQEGSIIHKPESNTPQSPASQDDAISISIKGIFEGEKIDICGYKSFSVKSLDDGTRFEIATEDREMPNRKFTGWHRVIPSQALTQIAPLCSISITSEVVAGNQIIYFEIVEGSNT